MLRHGATYAGHPACCAAALAVLDVYEREDLIARGRELEGPLHDALAPLADHPAVAEVRGGLGLLARRRSSPPTCSSASPRPSPGSRQGAREAGVLVRPLLGAVAVSPPLTIEQEHLDLIAEAFRAGLDSLGAAPPDPQVSSGL